MSWYPCSRLLHLVLCLRLYHRRTQDTMQVMDNNKFNHKHKVNIIEECRVAPPEHTLPAAINLPLTFFDIPWFYCHPVQRIFFYEFPHPTNHFTQSALATLKHSLSLTLQHFFPFSSNLIVPPHPQAPFIRYQHGDSLSFIVAESKADFNRLVSDSPQDVADWHPFVPPLLQQATLEDGSRVIPLMAIQVTVLPNSGLAICLSFNHVATDGKSLHHFIKFWANLCKEMTTKRSIISENTLLSLPFHDRSIVKDTYGLKNAFLEELRDQASKSMEFQGIVKQALINKVRATLVLTLDQIEKLKKFVFLKTSDEKHGSRTILHMSTFVVTCSLFWVCMIKSEEQSNGNYNKDYDELCHFVFLADCRGHPKFSTIPSTYFGNCLATGFVELKRGEIVGENGIAEVASAIEREVRDLRNDAFKLGENLMPKYRELGESGKSVLVVAGSPRLAVYETDFGWGKPNKSDAVHLDASGSISLSDSRDKQGAVEVGFALESTRMNTFINIFQKHLRNIDYCLSLNNSY